MINQSTTIINNYTLINITNGTPYTQPSGRGTVPGSGQARAYSRGHGDRHRAVPGSELGCNHAAVLCSAERAADDPRAGSDRTRPTAHAFGAAYGPADDLALGTGDVQATLLWNGDSDLDLHVTDPSGTDIYYLNKTSSTGGQLDHDDIPACGSPPRLPTSRTSSGRLAGRHPVSTRSTWWISGSAPEPGLPSS